MLPVQVCWILAWNCPSWALLSEQLWPWVPCSAWAPVLPVLHAAGPSRCQVREEQKGAAHSSSAPVPVALGTCHPWAHACPARPSHCHPTCASATSHRSPEVSPVGASARGQVGPQVLLG